MRSFAFHRHASAAEGRETARQIMMVTTNGNPFRVCRIVDSLGSTVVPAVAVANVELAPCAISFGSAAWLFWIVTVSLTIATVILVGILSTRQARLSERAKERGELATLRHSEEKYRGMFQASDDAMMLFDEDGFFDCNNATLRLFGFDTRASFLGIHPRDISPPHQPGGMDSLSLADQRIAEAVRLGSNRFEWIHRRLDGREFPAEVLLNAFDLGGKTVVQAVVRDITERRQTEDRYRLLAEGASDVIWTADLGLKWDYLSPAVERLTGYTVQEAMERPLSEILTPASVLVAENAIRKALESPNDAPRPLVLELEFNRKDGSTVWVEVNSTLLLAEDGTPVRWVGVSRDITARREFEAQLASARRVAEAADRSKSEFLANMSHEIRTPLTAILGFADLLREECDSDRLSSTAVDAVATIASNGQHLLDLINDILDLSKIEAGRTNLERNPCSPYQVVADVTALMSVRAQAKGLELKAEFVGPIPETVYTDATRLRQILVNLVGNAIKFTENGAVRVITSLVDDDANPCLRIDVSDTGCGVAEGDESRLFLPFTQADSSTSRRFGGTGLGLAISRKLAHLLGGDIALFSRLGQGSTFRLTLETGPIKGVTLRDYRTKSATSQSLQSPRTTRGRIRLQGRVLLVEDGPDNQRLISRILERAGGQVAIAENGRRACEVALAALAEGAPYDLLLMDMQMPIMDGYQATRVLREAGYRGTIIALTANAMVGDERKCLEAGCDAYLTKPIHHDTFLPCVAAHLTTESESAV